MCSWASVSNHRPTTTAPHFSTFQASLNKLQLMKGTSDPPSLERNDPLPPLNSNQNSLIVLLVNGRDGADGGCSAAKNGTR